MAYIETVALQPPTNETADTIVTPPARANQRRSWRLVLPAATLVGALLVAGCGSTKRSSGDVSNSNNPSFSVGLGSGQGSSSASQPKPGPAVLLPGSRHEEIQQFGAGTFTDYVHAYGAGPPIPLGQHVTVDCVATGPVPAAPSAEGKWYHMTGPGEYAGYYSAANTFENGDTTGPLSSQPPVDPHVPACPKG